MNDVAKKIFESLNERKWLSVEYKNAAGDIKNYWIDIKKINVKERKLTVDGLRLSDMHVGEIQVFLDSIVSCTVLDGTITDSKKYLVDDIVQFPSKYKSIFDNVTNFKILKYLSKCNKLDSLPYINKYTLVEFMDDEIITRQDFILKEEQFKKIVSEFQYKAQTGRINVGQLAMNALSIDTKQGLYVLAYRCLNLDVKNKRLRTNDAVTLNKEFSVNGEKMSITQFLDESDFPLLENYDDHAEEIKDLITKKNSFARGVNDLPYIFALAYQNLIDLDKEYAAILKMYEDDNVTVPIKAFFGELTDRSRRRKYHPIVLKNNKVNIAQLLAISKAIKNPIVYVQGPPGTGKTQTIINTILTAFFNDKTVLFSSYNNKPVDGVFEDLINFPYSFNGYSNALFPVIRLGNDEKLSEAIKYIKEVYDRATKLRIFQSALEVNKQEKIERTKEALIILAKYDERTELEERSDAIETLIKKSISSPFNMDLQTKHKTKVEQEIKNIGQIDEERIGELFDYDYKEFFKFVHFKTAGMLKKLDSPRYSDLMDILKMEDEKEQLASFKKYLKDDEKFQKLIKIFPVVLTTNTAAQKLGEPKVYFDKVIMDEAGQCDIAVSLVPIIRGNDLMLVGDPQQLKPVIVLDKAINAELKAKYSINDDYDYVEHSIYHTLFKADPINDEVLLKYHYRCAGQIIDFNNKKFYNNKLVIKSNGKSDTPLKIINVSGAVAAERNTSPNEVGEVIAYVKQNPDKKVGIITPFVNQKNAINERLKEEGLEDATCGTVHAFQGDEKDSIIFSLAVTKNTSQKTYDWLKNNKELINVATSRAKDELIIMASKADIQRLHNGDDDLYELIQYTAKNGESEVTSKVASSRALGIKPYSSETEEAFMENLNHALCNLSLQSAKYIVRKEVAINHVFSATENVDDLFYTGRFDFVVYEKLGKMENPILAIELDGKEHLTEDLVKARDARKQQLCNEHNLQLIRIPNTYARRYNHIKQILADFFER